MRPDPIRDAAFAIDLGRRGEAAPADRLVGLLADARLWCDLYGHNFAELNHLAYQQYLSPIHHETTSTQEAAMLEFEVWLDTHGKGEWSHSLRAQFRRQDDAIAYAEQQAKLRIDFDQPTRLRVIGPSGQVKAYCLNCSHCSNPMIKE
jgi:hypothetical protein